MLENNDIVSADYRSNKSDEEQSNSDLPKNTESYLDDSQMQPGQQSPREVRVECQVCNQQVILQRKDSQQKD